MGFKDLNFKAEINKLNSTMRGVVLVGLVALLAVSVGCFVEDYLTTVAGLELIPGRAVHTWLRPLLGLAPSAIQIVFMFVALTQRNRVAASITLLAWAFDFYTDFSYRMSTVEPAVGNWLIVAFFCFMVASFFSEFMLVFSLQHIAFTVGPALGGVWAGVRGAWRDAQAAAGQGLIDDAQRMLYPTTNGPAKKARAAADGHQADRVRR